MVDGGSWGGDEGIPGGDREWRFQKGELIVRAFEDFIEGAIGGVVTTASVELARFVAEEAPDGNWNGRLCVELGSGCGVVSGALVQLGARVVATEQAQFLEHLRWNLQLNTATMSTDVEAPRCEPLDWTCEESRARLRGVLGDRGADVVVGANCIYACDAVVPFISGISAIAGPTTEVYICGVPRPPIDYQEGASETILDAFLVGIFEAFDCYLVGTGAVLSTRTVANEERVAANGPPQAAAEGRPLAAGLSSACSASTVRKDGLVARAVAEQYGLPVVALADGVWLLLSPGAAPPAWVQPLIRLPQAV